MENRNRENQHGTEDKTGQTCVNGRDYLVDTDTLSQTLRDNNNCILKANNSSNSLAAKDEKTVKLLKQNVEKSSKVKSVYVNGVDMFQKLSDELILHIMRFLPKQYLSMCALVCHRWRQVSYDESLWTRMDISKRTVHTDTMAHVFLRNPRILRMVQVEIQSPWIRNLSNVVNEIKTKLEFLDLSMAVVNSKDLAQLLSKCKQLRKLSLEHCTVDEMVCRSISQNERLQTLNLAQCYELDATGLKHIMESCTKLEELNVQWTDLKVAALEVICEQISPQVTALCLAGNRCLSDELTGVLLDRCRQLQHLDVSDCLYITESTVDNLMEKSSELISLSISRCYRIAPACYANVVKHPKLKYLNLFGMLEEALLNYLGISCESRVQLNKFKFTPIARPTVGVRRTSIWGLRVRD